MKRLLFLFLSISSNLCFSAYDISGFWKTVNDDGVAQAIIAIYEYDGYHFGKIIASYGYNGKIDDSIYDPHKKAEGLDGAPYYSGMDIIWYLVDRGAKFKGEILDPEHGDVYRAEVWTEYGDLVVRGKLFIFGRSQTWYRVQDSDLPSSFKLPKLSELKPNIPKV